MKFTKPIFVLLFALTLTPLSYSLSAEDPAAEAQATYADISQTLGLVPQFMMAFPQESISGAWSDMKGIELNPKSQLPGKIKELISLAVSAQIPCRYCVYFHTEVAKFMGATDNEIKEAVAVSSVVRKWSALLNGFPMDMATYQQLIDKSLEYSREHGVYENIAINDSMTAFKDIEKMFGQVPPFVRAYPEAGIAGAWKEFKSLMFNPQTTLPVKYKFLIATAVSSQTPSAYCVYMDTKVALMNGAKDSELKESVAMAGMSRHWSTFLNGMQINEDQFKAEVQQILKYLKSQQPHLAR